MKKYTTNKQTNAKMTSHWKNSVETVMRVSTKKSVKSKNMLPASSKWLQRHINDPFVQASQKDGYRSRAAYKLLEIDEKYHIISNIHKTYLELGCTPGSWSQVVLQNSRFRFIKDGLLIGVDLLDCDLVDKKFHFIKGNFEDSAVLEKIHEVLNNNKIDVLLSDIAPNASGDQETDRLVQQRIFSQIINFILPNMNKNGTLICKMKCGSDDSTIINKVKKLFRVVERFKPQASRKESSEVYLICKGFSNAKAALL